MQGDGNGDLPKLPESQAKEQPTVPSVGNLSSDAPALAQTAQGDDARSTLKNLAREGTRDKKGTYSPPLKEGLEVPKDPIVTIAGKGVNLRDLYENRPEGENAYKGTLNIKDRDGNPTTVEVTISNSEILIEPTVEYGRLRMGTTESHMLNATLALKDPFTGNYLRDLPRGSEFLLAGYKFLSERNAIIKGFNSDWIKGDVLGDNYAAFEAARADFLAEYPEYAQWQEQVESFERPMREMKDPKGRYVFDDEVVSRFPRLTWERLPSFAKAFFHDDPQAFSEYQAVRKRMNEVEAKVNEDAAFETWTGKMMKVMGLTHAVLSARGPRVFENEHGDKEEEQLVSIDFTNPDASKT